MSRRAFVLALAVTFSFLLASCGLFSETKDETAGWQAERIYKEGHEAMEEGNYTRAVKMFETLEGRFPYGRYAQQAIIEEAYSQYKSGEQALAIAAADRFIKLYPNHQHTDYMYYLKGLASFNEDLGLFGSIADQDMSERDPKSARESYNAFRDLVAKFPNSRYAQDASLRMAWLVDALAAHEVHVARYYFNRGAYVAAAARGQNALVTYPRTPSNEEALAIMLRSYDALGLTALRDDARRLLAQNFPQNPLLTGSVPRAAWWKFWASNDDRYVSPASAAASTPAPAKESDKPWWKFW